MITKIIKFEANWCGPCKILGKTLESMKDEITIPVEYIDIDNDEENLCEKYMIRNIPVMILLDENNDEVSRLVGNVNKETILKALE